MFGLMATVLANYLTKKQLRSPRESSKYSAVTTSCKNEHGRERTEQTSSACAETTSRRRRTLLACTTPCQRDMNESALHPSAKVAWALDPHHSDCRSKTSALHGVGMYRIELSPGEETVFRTIEELAVAIKRGVITPRARIYHNASNKWLPIQFHPHYKTAVSMPLTQAKLVAGPPLKPLSTLTLKQPVEPDPPPFLPTTPLAEPIAPAERFTPQAESPKPKKKAPATPRASKRNRRPSKPRRQLRIALVGALLLGGAQWVLSAPLFSHPGAPKLISAQRHLITSPTAAMGRVSSPNSAAMVPVLPSPSGPSSAAPLQDEMPAALTAPSFGGAGVETATTPEIEPAPSAIISTVPVVPRLDSAISRADSSLQKAIRRNP